jgi:glycosyltransferase involved in cell wall biosynthesis
MRIVHVVATYLPAIRYGGPIQSVHGACRALAARGHDVHVVTTSVDGPGNSKVPIDVPVDIEGVNVWYYPSPILRRLFFSPGLAVKLSRLIPRSDIVHTHAIFLWPMLVAARIADGRTPYVVSPRGMLVSNLVARKNTLIKSAWIRLFERRTLERAAAVHVTSHREGSELAAFALHPKRVVVIPNGTDVPTSIERRPNDEHLLLYLGRISWEKGLDRLISALPNAPTAKLVIAGSDEEGHGNALRAQAMRLGVSGRIRFVGHVSGATKTDFFARASALILPSYSENFGNAALEAMAHGCPVIVTPEVGLADAIAQSEAGLVASGDPESLGRAMREILDDAQARDRMAEAARRLVLSRYTWPAVASSIEQLYVDIRSQRHPLL